MMSDLQLICMGALIQDIYNELLSETHVRYQQLNYD